MKGTIMEMKEINYQECCISCDQHNGWICADKNCPAHPAHKKCENYTQAYDKEAK